MRYFAHGALLLAVIGGVALAALEQPGGDPAVAPGAQTVVDDWSPSHLRPIFADDLLVEESTGSIERFVITQKLPLSDEQRSYVFLGVMNLPDIPELDIEARHLTVPLPDEIELQD